MCCSSIVLLYTNLGLHHVKEMSTKSLGQSENVRIFPLSVAQRLDLLIQLGVHGPAGLTQLLVQTLPGALVGGDSPPLDVVQLVVLHQAVPWAGWCGQGNTTRSCQDVEFSVLMFNQNFLSYRSTASGCSVSGDPQGRGWTNFSCIPSLTSPSSPPPLSSPPWGCW